MIVLLLVCGYLWNFSYNLDTIVMKLLINNKNIIGRCSKEQISSHYSVEIIGAFIHIFRPYWIQTTLSWKLSGLNPKDLISNSNLWISCSHRKSDRLIIDQNKTYFKHLLRFTLTGKLWLDDALSIIADIATGKWTLVPNPMDIIVKRCIAITFLIPISLTKK